MTEWLHFNFHLKKNLLLKNEFFFSLNVYKDFHGGPGVKTLPSNAGGMGSTPGQGAKISHASRLKKSKHKTETVLWQSQKDFKNGPHKKKS